LAPRDEYGRIASIYDPATALFLDPARRAVVRLALARGAANILDVCCGTGRQLALLTRFGLSGAGIDLSPAMLEKARRQCPPGTPFFRVDAGAMPFRSQSFDLSIISFALHEKPPGTREAILAEALRVTRPGGAVAVTDYVLPAGASRLASPLVRFVERAAGREHFANYRDYMAGGASEGLFYRQGVTAVKTGSYLFGCAGLFLISPETGT